MVSFVANVPPKAAIGMVKYGFVKSGLLGAYSEEIEPAARPGVGLISESSEATVKLVAEVKVIVIVCSTVPMLSRTT